MLISASVYILLVLVRKIVRVCHTEAYILKCLYYILASTYLV